ncbi:hypothetical protein pb186bvf_011172 [Paramecium bursaria]
MKQKKQNFQRIFNIFKKWVTILSNLLLHIQSNGSQSRRVYTNQNNRQCVRTFSLEPAQANNVIDKVKKSLTYSHPNIVKITKLEEEIEEQFCSSFKRVHVTMEYSDQTITILEQNQIKEFIFQVIQGLIYLDFKGVDTCQFSPSKILQFGTEFKLVDTSFLQEVGDFQRLYFDQVPVDEWMISPEVMTSVKTTHIKNFNNQKATVFNFGIIMVYLLTQIHPMNALIYNYDLGRLTNHFDNYINLINNDFPTNIQTIVKGCCRIEPSQRISYKEILEQLTIQEIPKILAESPQKPQQEYRIPSNQQLSFNPSYEDVNRVLTELQNNSQEKVQSPKFMESICEQSAKPKVKKLYNLENKYVASKRNSTQSTQKPVSNQRWK